MVPAVRPLIATLCCWTVPAGSGTECPVGDVVPHVTAPGVGRLVHHDTTAVVAETFDKYGPRVINSVPVAGVDADRPDVPAETLPFESTVRIE
jgi:hypothetical protein